MKTNTQTLQPEECHSKKEIRDAIDQIDQQIIQLFAKRFAFVKEIVKYKEHTPDAIIDQERKDLVIRQRANWADEMGLDAHTFAHIYEYLIEHNISKELEIARQSK